MTLKDFVPPEVLLEAVDTLWGPWLGVCMEVVGCCSLLSSWNPPKRDCGDANCPFGNFHPLVSG